MAKIKGPLYSTDAQGTVGKTLSFSKFKGIPRAFKKSHPANPQTPAQQLQRSYLAEAILAWRDLDQASKQYWQQQVESKRLKMSGYNYFLSDYIYTKLAPPPAPKYAINFDGVSDQYVNVPYSALMDPSNITVEAWFYCHSFPSFNDDETIVAHDDWNASEGWWLNIWNDGGTNKAEFVIFTTGGLYGATYHPALSLDTWYHAAGTYDGNTCRFWLNGIEGTPDVSGTPLVPCGNPLRFACRGFTEDFFMDGRIYEVRLSDIVRYTSDFTPPTEPFTPDANTIGLWHCDEGEGITAGDSSGNNLHGTLINGPTWVER